MPVSAYKDRRRSNSGADGKVGAVGGTEDTELRPDDIQAQTKDGSSMRATAAVWRAGGKENDGVTDLTCSQDAKTTKKKNAAKWSCTYCQPSCSKKLQRSRRKYYDGFLEVTPTDDGGTKLSLVFENGNSVSEVRRGPCVVSDGDADFELKTTGYVSRRICFICRIVCMRREERVETQATDGDPAANIIISLSCSPGGLCTAALSKFLLLSGVCICSTSTASRKEAKRCCVMPRIGIAPRRQHSGFILQLRENSSAQNRSGGDSNSRPPPPPARLPRCLLHRWGQWRHPRGSRTQIMSIGLVRTTRSLTRSSPQW